VNSSPTTATHETNLDFVRALAVLMVVCSHLAWFFGNVHLSFLQPSVLGKLGVIIFFVHSGIVNMLSIDRHVQKHGDHRLFRSFMTRRCLRIYPLSIVVVSIIFFAKVPVGHIDKLTTSVGQHAGLEFIPSLLLMQNFARFDQILEPLWSLPYEVQIYCSFPLIYLALRRLRSTKALLFAWALLAAVDHVMAPHFLKHANVGRFVIVPDMLFYFLLFLAGLQAFKEMQTATRELRFVALPAILAVVALLWLFSQDNTKCILISMCLGLALPHIQGCEIAIVNSVCGWIAKYSYGIYLLHDPAIWFGFVRLGHMPVFARIAIFLVATFGGSVLVYYAIEHPMLVIGNKAAATISGKNEPAKIRAAAATAGTIG
jgi:peptidoglycan/LPS O-acetylase OafA/YrhL